MNISERQEVAAHNVDLVIQHVVTVVHYRVTASGANEWVNGGTGWLFELGSKRWFITAAHVVEGYLSSLGHNYKSFIGGHECEMFEISGWKVDAIDSELDYCLIQVAADFEPCSINKSCYKPHEWPLERAGRGDETFIVGFPGKLRKGDKDVVHAAVCYLSDFVASTTDSRLTIVNENEPRVEIPILDGITTPEHFGGMSGAPVWKIHRDGWVKPVGIFILGGGADSPYFATHIDLLFGFIK
ncbi:serine protease [Pseudomonas syringae pv. syringae]|uniref:S1 family peptidase n=1 Tax=Pseudomonas syringae TaxID=317 RepID=UPI00200AFD54|nr:serine protease [Pseudomonas syringae]MCK9701883.1 serine protease [Pseudomonas syringae pv. syringae]MCK9757379.1 serine protease [Pseudomonas syringae pv. syringae]MCK9773606.1 serine protease [Pseudomonas syringae pv. syringae]